MNLGNLVAEQFIQDLIAFSVSIIPTGSRYASNGGFYYFSKMVDVRKLYTMMKPHHTKMMMIKWENWKYSLIIPDILTPDWLDHAYIPSLYHGSDRYFYAAAFADQKHYLFFDIEWYDYYEDGFDPMYDMERVLKNDAAALERVAAVYKYFVSFWMAYLPAHWYTDSNGIKHGCVFKPYWSCGTRWDDSGRRKQSFHLTVRCLGNCFFNSMEHLASYMKPFVTHVKKDKKAPDYCYYKKQNGELESVVDCGIYNVHRFMRMPGSSKAPGELPLSVVSLQDSDPSLNSTLAFHVHCCDIGSGSPYPVYNPPNSRLARQLSYPSDVIPAMGQPSLDPVNQFVNKVLTDLKVPQDQFIVYGHSEVSFCDSTFIFNTVLTFVRGVGDPSGFSDENTYPAWFRVCRALCRFVSGDVAWGVWEEFTRWAPKSKRHDPRRQFNDCWAEAQRKTLRLSLEAELKFICMTAKVEFNPRWCANTTPRLCPIHNMPMKKGLVPLDIEERSVFFRCECIGNGGSVYLGDYNHPYTYVTNQVHLQEDARVNQFLEETLQLRSGFVDLVVRSNMGTGKTFLLEGIHEKLPNARILCITCRRALAAELKTRLSMLNFQHYKDPGLNVDDPSLRLLIQLDSLTRHISLATLAFDVVIAEELESFLAYCSSSTFSARRASTFVVLRSVFLKAKRVIALDADIGDRSLHFLASVRPTSTKRTLIGNLATPLSRYVLLHQRADVFGDDIIRSYQKGLNFCIVSNSKVKLHVYYEMLLQRFPEDRDKILLYTGDSDSELRSTIPQCNDLWITKRVVLWTPVISAGVNFWKRYFHLMFIVGVSSSTPIRELLQQAGRIRELSTSIVHVYLDRPNDRDTQIMDFTSLKESLASSLMANDRVALYLIDQGAVLDPQTNFFRLDDPLTKVLFMNYLEEVRTKNNIVYEFKLYCKRHGDIIDFRGRPDPADPLRVSSADLRKLMDVVREDAVKSFADAPRAEELDTRDDTAPVSRHTVNKEILCRLFGLPNITNQFIISEFVPSMGVSLCQFAIYAVYSMTPRVKHQYVAEITRRVVSFVDPGEYTPLDSFHFFSRVFALEDIPVQKYLNNRHLEMVDSFFVIFKFELKSPIHLLNRSVRSSSREHVLAVLRWVKQNDFLTYSGNIIRYKSGKPKPRIHGPSFNYDELFAYLQEQYGVLTDAEKSICFNFPSFIFQVVRFFFGFTVNLIVNPRQEVFQTLAHHLFPGCYDYPNPDFKFV